MTNQTGYAAEGDQFNVAHDYNDYTTNNYYDSKRDADDDGGDDEPGGSRSGNHTAEKSGVSIVVLAVVAGILYGIFGGDEPFPTQSDPWPASVEQSAVVATVGSWLEKCQKSESSSPNNCPQSLVDDSGKVSRAHWAFYGSYLEAPVIKYSKDESLFDVLGTMVTSADYMVSKSPRRVVTPMKFWAKVSWLDGNLDVREIKEHSAVGDPEVVKVEPSQPWSPVESKLLKEFERCMRGANLSLPAGCPDWEIPKDAKKVKWSLEGNPVLTARSSFDQEFGIFRVNGTYGMTVSYTSRGAAKHETRGLDYEALVTTSESGPVILQIKDAV